MITHLRGVLAHRDIAGPSVEIDVGGVRYEVLVPLFLWPELEALGSDDGDGPPPEIGLYIHYSASANQPVPVLVGFLRR
ncbi:MAG: OB-fold domain-containing protein, partial [Hyphomicrobiales bacterium]